MRSKNILMNALVGLTLFLSLNSNAFEFKETYSGEATLCYTKYALWSGTCNGGTCEYPPQELAEGEILKQVYEERYGCTQLTPYTYNFTEFVSNTGQEICMTTKASATFSCFEPW